MPLPPGLETLANNALDYLLSQMDAIQDDYLVANGHYFQGIKTPPVIPEGGNVSAPDLGLKPTDQDDDWTGKIDTTARPISMEVNIHETPNGWGFSCVGYISVGLDTYVRSIGVGDGGITFDWELIVDPVV